MKTVSVKLSIALMILTIQINAQDIITKTDSSRLTTTILEVNLTTIKYKLYNYNDGPLCTLNKNDIAYIIYKTGSSERFQVQSNTTNYHSLESYRTELSPEEKNKKCEPLYKRKNFIGFNYIAFLNNCVGFNYMRDVSKGNLIISVPFAIGIGSPIITNALYGDSYIRNSDDFKYNKLNYQVGISAFLTPNMKREVNFLIGPSFNYSSFDVTSKLNYVTVDAMTNTRMQHTYKNTFELRRKNYGMNVGFLARFSERVNMNMTLTLGYKIDTYNQKDPFGIEYAKSQPGSTFTENTSAEPVFYANFLWSVGYRF